MDGRFDRAPLEQQIILVTGSTDGIGRQTALELARKGARVIVHGRDEKKADLIADMIRKKTGNNKVHFTVADFTSFRQVNAMAQDVQNRFPHLDVLINNAGTYMDGRTATEDGHETTLQVNLLSPFLLTHRLLGFLRREEEVRIVNVTSVAHRSSGIDFNNLDGQRGYDGYSAYAQSKLGLILFTFELARRLSGTNILCNCVHPGVIDTKLLRKGWGAGGASVKEGAEALVYVATSDSLEGVTGRYFEKKEPGRSSPISYNETAGLQLWETAADMCGISPPPAEDISPPASYQPGS